MPPRARADVIATVSSVIDYFENIVTRGIQSNDFRSVSARLTALNIMLIAHMISLHTREVRTLGDLDFYVKHQLDMIFAGLQVAPRERSGAAATRRRGRSTATRAKKKRSTADDA
jgi:hypothetical protein